MFGRMFATLLPRSAVLLEVRNNAPEVKKKLDSPSPFCGNFYSVYETLQHMCCNGVWQAIAKALIVTLSVIESVCSPLVYSSEHFPTLSCTCLKSAQTAILPESSA